MEFWGVEVKPGETVKCDPGDDRYLHLSQASLGESKKDKASENVPVFVKFNDQKLVLGTLSGEKCPQISYDLVFEKEFELSHSSKSTSVYFFGYKTGVTEGDFEGYSKSDSEEEDIQLVQKVNGKPEVKEQVKPAIGKPNSAKADASSAKPKVMAEEPKKADIPKIDDDEDDDEDDDDDDDDEDDESEDESSDDEGMPDVGDDSDDEDEDEDEDESSDEEDEATPKKADGKKRPAVSTSKTPAPEKKAKLISPAGSQKTGGDGKKGIHTATPYPAKQVGKTPANNEKSKQQTPKSGAGSVSCGSCSKTFNSDNALQAHTKAKHSTSK